MHFAEWGAALSALVGGVRAGRLDGLARLPVCALHRPGDDVLEAAEDRSTVPGVLAQPEAVGPIDAGPTPRAFLSAHRRG